MSNNRTIVTRLRAEMAQFRKEWASGAKAVDDAADSMDKAAGRAKTATKAVDESGTAVGRLSAVLKNNRADWDTVGTSLLKTGAAMVAMSALTVKAAIDWETAWTGVTKTTNGTKDQMAQLENGLRGLAKTLPSSHAEIAAVAEAAGQLGVQRENIVGFTKTMIDLGQTTNLTADEAATSLAQFMNIMGTAPDVVDNLGSSLVALGNDGASTEAEILEMAQRIAGAGKIVGLSEGDVLGLSSALASVGIEADAGGSSVSAILIDISKAVATNSDDLAKWAAVSGMSVDEFSAKWKTSPAEGFEAFTRGLGEVNAAGGDVFTTLDQLGQSDVRVTRALLGMAASGDLLGKNLRTGNTALERNTALTAEAEKRYDTTAAKAEIAWNSIKDNAIDAGQSILPVVAQVADVVGDVTGAFSSLPGPVKSGLGALTGIAGVSLLAVGGLMKVAASVADTRSAFGRMTADSSRTSMALGRVGKAAGAAAATVTAFSVAGALFGDSGDAKKVNVFTKALLELSQGGKGAKDNLNDLFKVDAPGYSGMLYKNVEGLGDALKEVAAGKGFGDNLKGFLQFDTRIAASSKAVTQLDNALANLVSQGAVDEAASGFDYVSKVADKQGVSVARLKELLPTYADALAATDVQQKLTGQSSSKLGGDLEALSPEAQKAKDDLDALKESTTQVSLSFIDWTKGVGDNKLSFGEWTDGLRKMLDAQKAWQENMLKASVLGASDETLAKLKEMGPEGARLLDEMVKGGKKSVDELNDILGDATDTAGAFSNAINSKLNEIPLEKRLVFSTAGEKGAIEKVAALAQEVGLTPGEVTTILRSEDWATADIKAVRARMAELDQMAAHPMIGVEIGGALGQIRLLQRTINGMNGKTVRVAVQGGTGGGMTTNADGGVWSYYANGGLRDASENHIAQIAPAGAMRVWAEPETGGEAYIPLAGSKRPRSRSIAEQTVQILGGTIQWFADGGVSPASKLDIKQAQQQVRDIQRSLDETERYGKKPKKGKDRRPRRHVLRGLDREVVELQLVEAKRELRDLRSNKAYKQDRADQRAEKAKQVADDKAAAAERLASDTASAKSTFAGNFKIGSLSSTAAVDRQLERTLADAGTFLGLLGDLKSEGASPWLLQQLAEAGPTKGAIKLARQYATDSAALARVNARASQIDALTSSYAGFVSNPSFMAPQAWNAGLSQQSSKTYEIKAYAPAEVAREISRVIRFDEDVSARGAGV